MNARVFILALLLIVIGGGYTFLLNHDIPAPRHNIEKPLSNDRFVQ